MLLIALLLPLLQAPPEVPVDVVTDTSGREHLGVILLDTKDLFVLQEGSKTKEYARKKIATMAGPRVAYGSYCDQLELVYAQHASAKDAVDLAEWCQTYGLLRDVEMHYWQALVKDPQNVAARTALGHRRHGEEWQAPTDRGAWLTLEELNAWHNEQNQPWLFYTAHFQIEANADLADALRAAAHLELLYGRYYEVLQDLAGFYELLLPLKVRIYANRESGYPEVGPNVLGYFDWQTEIINTWFEQGSAKNLVRITCHALQFRGVTERARARPDDYPGWLSEGVATYFDSSFTKNDALADFHFERLNLDWLRIHQQAKPALDLDEVLNLPITGFQDRKKADLAHAQAYSLLFFLLHEGSQDLKTGFGKYLHGVFTGRGGSSAFKKSFISKRYKGLEKEWTDFVVKSVLRDQK